MESADLKPGSMESADLKPSLADLRASMEAFYANKIREEEITKMLSSEPARNESGTERPSSSDIAIPPIPTGSIGKEVTFSDFNFILVFKESMNRWVFWFHHQQWK